TGRETSVTHPPRTLRLQFADDMFLRRHGGPVSPAVNQVLWRLDAPYDAERLRDLAGHLAAGALHRRVVRARVPGARHTWAPAATLPALDLQTAPVPADGVATWAQTQADVPLDPARGRAWRLSATDVQGAGAVVSLTCAHAVADGAALIDAVVRAATHAAPMVVPEPERGVRALLADVADAAGRTAAVARWAWARALKVLHDRRSAPAGAATAGADVPPPAPTHPAPSHPAPSRPAVDDAAWRAPVLHVELPPERVAAAAAQRGGTPNTWFVAFLARLVHPSRRFRGQPVPVAPPVATRGPDDPRANSTKIARVTVPADVLAARDLGWVRAAAKEAYAAVGRSEPGAVPVPLELVQMLPDAVVHRLPQPPVAAALASNLG